MQDSLLSIAINSHPYKLPHRYARLALVRNLSKQHLDPIKCCTKNEVEEKMKVTKRFLFGRKARSTANKEFLQLVSNKKLLVERNCSVLQYDTDALKFAIKCILADENICLFSWGSRKITVGNTVIENFPNCPRKKLLK